MYQQLAVAVLGTSLVGTYKYTTNNLSADFLNSIKYEQGIYKPTMYDTQFTLYFPKSHIPETVCYILDRFISISKTKGLVVDFFTINDKTNNTIAFPHDWNIGDTIRVRVRCDAFSHVPEAVKTKYNLVVNNYPFLVLQLCIENLTTGTVWITHQPSIGLGNSVQISKFGEAAPLSGISIKYFKYWNKPLPTDWLLI